MLSFEDQMAAHQVAWRRANLASRDFGWQNGKQHEWILPQGMWEAGLYPGIRSGQPNSLPAYLEAEGIQRHPGSHNLKSSWTLCANLYFPFRAPPEGRGLLAGFLRERVHRRVERVDRLELEYAEPVGSALHPSALLGEEGGTRGANQTSPDLAFVVNGGQGLILTENKFVEHSFYRCSAAGTAGSEKHPANPDPSRCLKASAVLAGPQAQCQQVAWGRKYWQHLQPAADRARWATLRTCPAATAGYQLFRQQALAEGIAASGQYQFVVSCLAVDARNEDLRTCLAATGIPDIRHWGGLFRGKAAFAVFTHQEWVRWVASHGDRAVWGDWLRYVEARYGY